MVAEPRHVPGEAGNEVDLFRVGLEVDEKLGLLRRADAGEVPQPLVGPVLLALHPSDAVPETEQDLVDGRRQLSHRPIRRAHPRRLRRTATTGCSGNCCQAGDRSHRLKAEVLGAEVAVADQVDAAPVLPYGVHVVAGEVAGHADQPGRAPQHLGRGRRPEPVADQMPELGTVIHQPGQIEQTLIDHAGVSAALVLDITDRRSSDTDSELR